MIYDFSRNSELIKLEVIFSLISNIVLDPGDCVSCLSTSAPKSFQESSAVKPYTTAILVRGTESKPLIT